MAEALGLIAEQAAFDTLGRALRSTLSPGDHRVVLTASVLSSFSTQQVRAYNDSGKYDVPEGRFNAVRTPAEATIALEDLRSASYRDGVGTWYTVVAQVDADGRFTAKYDYDHEPSWPHPIDPVTYVNDLEAFPRDEEHRPDWLKQRVAEVTATS